jgi:SAM-dependent methyltransferase
VQVEAAPDNVVQLEDVARGSLPFPDASFGLVTSRHESFVASEVARVLRPGGAFLTQQTGGDYGDFYDALGLERPAAPPREWDLRLAVEQLERAGLRVTDSAEGAEATTFADAGALAWYLRAVPWVVEAFATATHRPHLEQLQARVDAEGPITLLQPSFWLKAVKPELG